MWVLVLPFTHGADTGSAPAMITPLSPCKLQHQQAAISHPFPLLLYLLFPSLIPFPQVREPQRLVSLSLENFPWFCCTHIDLNTQPPKVQPLRIYYISTLLRPRFLFCFTILAKGMQSGICICKEKPPNKSPTQANTTAKMNIYICKYIYTDVEKPSSIKK